MTIKLLAVDDSALMRKTIRSIFDAEGDFEVETARNGLEALEKAKSFALDVMTLDVNMPELDGLGCLKRLMAERPTPVVMLSSLTAAGAETTLEALALGAVDFVEKPGGTISRNLADITNVIVPKVRAAASAQPRRTRRRLTRRRAAPISIERRAKVPLPPMRASAPLPGLILIGVSTGGPQALEEILPALPPTLGWPVLVAQHMPASFTGVMAHRLDKLCALRVVEVAKPMPIEAGTIYFARGDADLEVQIRLGRLTAAPMPSDESRAYHPNVDRLVHSALGAVPANGSWAFCSPVWGATARRR